MSFEPVFHMHAQYTMLAGLIGYFDKLVLLDTNGDPIPGQEMVLDVDIVQPGVDHNHLPTGFLVNLTPDASFDLPQVSGSVTVGGIGVIHTDGNVVLSKEFSSPLTLGDAQYLTIPQHYYLTVGMTPNNEL